MWKGYSYSIVYYSIFSIKQGLRAACSHHQQSKLSAVDLPYARCKYFQNTWVNERQSMFALPKYMCFLSTTQSFVWMIPPVMFVRSTSLTSAPEQKKQWIRCFATVKIINTVKLSNLPVSDSSSVFDLYVWGALIAIFKFTPLGSSCFKSSNSTLPWKRTFKQVKEKKA